MATTTAKAFSEFLDLLEPTTSEKITIASRAGSVSGYLKKSFDADSDMPLRSSTVIGSGAKGTGVRPVDDVDVLAVFDNAQAVYDKYRWDSKQFLYRVKNALDGYSVKVVGARGQAVRLFYQSGPYADIAPVLPVSGGGYYLPAGDGTWISTNPQHDADWLAGKNSELGGHVKPMIKLAKAWNREHSSRFRSFHLEVMVASAFTSLGGNYRQAMKLWFEHPNISVSGPWSGKALDDYMWLFSDSRKSAVSVLNSSADRAIKALDAEAAGDHKEAIRLWGVIFGDDFPAYG